MKVKSCPFCRKKMVFRRLQKSIHFRGVTFAYESDAFVCTECGQEAGTIESAGNTQRAIADAFREKKGLLTGGEICALRRGRSMDHEALAVLLDVDPVQIQRWENGLIQGKKDDRKLREFLVAQ
jgi:putative zinc finger/helix-turn-helix YgiT family protein